MKQEQIEKVKNLLASAIENCYKCDAKVYQTLLDSSYADDELMLRLIDFLWDYFAIENWICEIEDVDEACAEHDKAIDQFTECMKPGNENALKNIIEDAKCFLEDVHSVQYSDSDIKERLPWIINNYHIIFGM